MYLENKVSRKINCLSPRWMLRMKGWGPQTLKMENIYLIDEFFIIKILKMVTRDRGAGREKELEPAHFMLTMQFFLSRLRKENPWRKKLRGNSTWNFEDFLPLVFTQKKVT